MASNSIPTSNEVRSKWGDIIQSMEWGMDDKKRMKDLLEQLPYEAFIRGVITTSQLQLPVAWAKDNVFVREFNKMVEQSNRNSNNPFRLTELPQPPATAPREAYPQQETEDMVEAWAKIRKKIQILTTEACEFQIYLVEKVQLVLNGHEDELPTPLFPMLKLTDKVPKKGKTLTEDVIIGGYEIEALKYFLGALRTVAIHNITIFGYRDGRKVLPELPSIPVLETGTGYPCDILKVELAFKDNQVDALRGHFAMFRCAVMIYFNFIENEWVI